MSSLGIEWKYTFLVLQSLLRTRLVSQSDLANILSLPPTVVQRTLSVLTGEGLVQSMIQKREVEVEKTEDEAVGTNDQPKKKSRKVQQFYIDPRIFCNVIQTKLFRMSEELHTRLSNLQGKTFRCPKCAYRFSALQVGQLMQNGAILCDECHVELEPMSNQEEDAIIRARSLMTTQMKVFHDLLAECWELPLRKFITVEETTDLEGFGLKKSDETGNVSVSMGSSSLGASSSTAQTSKKGNVVVPPWFEYNLAQVKRIDISSAPGEESGLLRFMPLKAQPDASVRKVAGPANADWRMSNVASRVDLLNHGAPQSVSDTPMSFSEPEVNNKSDDFPLENVQGLGQNDVEDMSDETWLQYMLAFGEI